MHKLLILLFTIGTITVFGQSKNTYSTSADADPKAKATLDKLRKKYESFNSLEATFTLTIEVPEQPEEIQQGTLAQKGDKYRLELNDQHVYSDGQSLWLYLKNNNEVQINNVDETSEEGEILSPKDMLKIYEKENYTYALTKAFTENGRLVEQIEFKPLDEYSEYAKLRLTVDKKNNDIARIKVFSKDGSRYTLEMTSLTPNKNFQDSYFVFNPDNFPGIYVEDLRID